MFLNCALDDFGAVIMWLNEFSDAIMGEIFNMRNFILEKLTSNFLL